MAHQPTPGQAEIGTTTPAGRLPVPRLSMTSISDFGSGINCARALCRSLHLLGMPHTVSWGALSVIAMQMACSV